MGFLSGHRHTYITDTINNVITSDEYVLEIELGKIVKLIKADSEYTSTSNQIEAARAIRKHLKYGNTKQQVRALELLNLLVSQMVRLPALFNDTKLLERLQGIAMNTEQDSRGRNYESKVIRRCISYILVWTTFLTDNAHHLEAYDGLLELGNRVQSRIRKRASREGSSQQRGSKTSRRRAHFMQDSADRSIHPGNGHYGVSNIELEEETPKIKMLISDSLAASTSLHNALLALKKGKSPIDDEEATLRFAEARELRRKVLRYLQLVTGGEFLGSLIRANEELVDALSKYDELVGANLDDGSSSSDSSFDGDSPVVNPFDDKNEI